MKKWLFLSIVFCAGFARAQIVFDVSRDQPFFPHDAGYAGSSLFAAELYRAGYAVSLNRLPLDRLLAETRPVLLVVPPTIFRQHADSEVQAVIRYVKSGGSLLLVCEHENYFGNAGNLNRFLEGSGISILADKAENPSAEHFADRSRPSVLTPATKKDSVVFYLPALLQLADSTASVARTPAGECLAAVAPWESGRVGVVADLEIFWNMSPATGIRYGQNKEFVLYLVRRLAGEGAPKRPAPVRKNKNIWINGACFEADLGKPASYRPLTDALQKKGYGIRYTDFTDGVPGRDDICLVLCEPSSAAETAFIQQCRRVFYAGFMTSDFWGNVLRALDGFARAGYDETPMRETVAQLWKHDRYVHSPDPYITALEKTGAVFPGLFSSGDSIQTMSVPVALDTMFTPSAPSAPFNYFERLPDASFEVLLWGRTHTGTGYPAPVENHPIMAKNHSEAETVPVVLARENRVFSGCGALWRSDFSDKKLQREAVAKAVEVLTR